MKHEEMALQRAMMGLYIAKLAARFATWRVLASALAREQYALSLDRRVRSLSTCCDCAQGDSTSQVQGLPLALYPMQHAV